MNIVAAFLWTKSPRCSISTMIFAEEIVQIFSQPKISYLPKGFFSFRKHARKTIKEFFYQIEELYKISKMPIIIEFKIVFNTQDIPYLKPAKESIFVYNYFLYLAKKIKKKIKHIIIKPQLKQKLSGRALKQFKKELRSLCLVSRKRDTGFEYHLWAVALHATKANYADKLKMIRNSLVNAIWRVN